MPGNKMHLCIVGNVTGSMTEAPLTALFLDEEMAETFSINLCCSWCHLSNNGRHIPYWQRYCCIILDLFRHGYNAGVKCLTEQFFSIALSDCCFRLVLLHWKAGVSCWRMKRQLVSLESRFEMSISSPDLENSNKKNLCTIQQSAFLELKWCVVSGCQLYHTWLSMFIYWGACVKRLVSCRE